MLLAIDGPVLLAVIPATGTVIEENTILKVAPRELLLRFDSAIDPASLTTGGVAAIQFTRAVDDVRGNGNDLTVTPGFIGIGNNPIDVIVRFTENLPDDLYQMTIVGAGPNALKDTSGKAFNNSQNLLRNFALDLGAQVEAVVPQPLTRDANGKLQQPAVNQIDVYFNVNDPLDVTSAQNPLFYQLIRTAGTATPQDDQVFNPINVTYSPGTGKAVLTFNTSVLTTVGTYRLRIGTSEPLALAPVTLSFSAAGSSFGTAATLGAGGNPFPAPLGTQTIQLFDGISSVGTPAGLIWPGSPLEPGERDPDIESHVSRGSNNGAIEVREYNFQSNYGSVLNQPVFNLITETQKQRVREIFSYYSHFLGIQFVETTNPTFNSFTIATGDVRAVNPSLPPTYLGGATDFNRAIINALNDWGASERGGGYFTQAMDVIGALLGLGRNVAAPGLTVRGVGGGEPVFPGDHDILYGRFLWPALGNDINVYRFTLSSAGQLNIETIAERLRSLGLSSSPSQLDSVITLYDSAGKIVARNDNYYGKDSFVQLDLATGTYFVAITSTGNTAFDPTVTDSGFGGTTQGSYQLRMTFTPTVPLANSIHEPVDPAQNQTGTRLDGDRDGAEGGVSNFWFKVDGAHTLFVDKASTGGTGALGSLTNPYTTISNALAAATSGTIVRIVGNGGADGLLGTTADNFSYNIGFNSLNQPLSDGSTFNVPRGVTVMIDAGTIIKLRGANIDVGSSAQGIDRSAGALQVLGTTAKDALGRDIGSVHFVSYYDKDIGDDPPAGVLAKGNWGGLVFRNDSDLESAGIFLNYVNHAKLSHGGGQVSVNSVLSSFAPIHVETSRPTITYNTIVNSADSAISADPNSFEESEFIGSGYHADYSRVGPRVYGNSLTQNTINGLFVRIRTLNGSPIDELTVSARMANTDIVHVLKEVLQINGEPGGFFRAASLQLTARPSARLALDPGIVLKLGGARIETEIGAQFIAEGTTDRPIIFTSEFDDRYGASGTVDTTNDGTATTPQKRDWSGFYFGPLSIASIDRAFIAFAGGTSGVEGAFDTFDPLEINQAQVRITNSTFDENAAPGGGNRNGRSGSDQSVIFIRGAQPVILNNVIKNNSGVAMSVNVNSLNAVLLDDWGRSRGRIDLLGSFSLNTGPLIDNNLIGDNAVNGLVVRGGTITTNVIWDDTDIVHVVGSTVQVLNQQSLSGTLRLQSSASESLVVKLLGTNTDIVAAGDALDIPDRTGGSLQIVGTPNHPVVLTSVKDDTVGAGLTPQGLPQKDTLNRKGVVAPALPLLPTQGPVILDATARDVHGTSGASTWAITLLREVNYIFTNSRREVPEGRENVILYIGESEPPPDTDLTIPYSREAIDFVASQLGLTVEYASSSPAIAGVDFNDYKMVYIPSHSAYPLPNFRAQRYSQTNWWGGIDDFQLSVLNTRKADLIDYINNRGGGLLAMAQDSASAPYSFLAAADPFILRKSGGNVMTATSLAPSNWWDDFNLRDDRLNIGTPYRAAFKGTTGFNRLEPWAVDPVTGEIAMLGLAAGGVGLGAPRDIVAPADWGSIRLDLLSNDRNVEIINELEQGFSAAGDTNQLPATAQFLGELAKDQVSGDDNVRLGFEIHGGISQATDSPGGSDVDVYSFRGTAGTRVWIDIDRTASSLDSVVELVDANGAVIAGSDSSIFESLPPGSPTFKPTVGIARPMPLGAVGNPSPFSNPDFYTTNFKDAGMRVDLPGAAGTVNTYFVRVRSSSSNLSNLTGGQTKGAYVMQVRLQELDEFAGSTVRYADIRFATNGIEVIGKPEHSPLMSTTAETSQIFDPFFDPEDPIIFPSNNTFLTAQNLGNLLSSDRRELSVAGKLATETQVDWYKFELNQEQVDFIAGFSDGLKSFAAMLRINYADGVVRPDTTMYLYDDQGRLLLMARDSQVVDALPRPNSGSDSTNLGHGSYGVLDPTLGPVRLGAGPPVQVFGEFRLGVVTYYVAVTSASQLPEALSALYTASTSTNPLIRLQPLDTIERVPANTSINVQADPYQLGDVVLFVDTFTVTTQGTTTTRTSALQMVNPFTGATMGSPTTLELPDTNDPFGYSDIAMRNDGRLFSLSQGDNDTSTGNYVEFNTATGAIVNLGPEGPLDDNLKTYRLSEDTDTMANPPIVEFVDNNNGIWFEAMAYLQSPNSTSRRLYAIGNRRPGDSGAGGNVAILPEIKNLLFELDPNTGQVMHEPPGSMTVWNEVTLNSGTNAVPFGNFGKVNDNVNGFMTGMAIIGNRMFTITDRGNLYEIFGFDAPTAVDGAIVSPSLGQLALPPGGRVRGLTAGPQNVEGGAYANVLFAIDSDGDLYALNTDGTEAHVFLNGASHLLTDISGAQGLAFSTLDSNLWHQTSTRASDPGHSGGSFYFGIEGSGSQPGATAYTSNPDILNTYGLPGGAYGSVTSNTFSLEGYSAYDLPTLYFNYLLDTNDVDSGSNLALDAMRVMISNNGVNWELLATSNTPPGAETPSVITPNGGAYNGGSSQQKVQGLWEADDTIPDPEDLNKVWRQARVDLADFAGQSNLRLRFQFSTAGTMGSGSLTTGTGTTLQAVAASQLRDGWTFNVDSTTFTIRKGFALTVRAGGGPMIADGETMTIDGTTFEFNKPGGGVSGTNIAIPITDQQSAEGVAASILAVLPLSLRAVRFGARVELPGATAFSSVVPAGLILEGAALPSSPAATDLIVELNSLQMTVGSGLNINHDTTLTVNGTIFKFDKGGGVSGGIAIPITSLQSAAEVAQTIISVLSGFFPNTRQGVGANQVEVPDAGTMISGTPGVVVSRVHPAGPILDIFAPFGVIDASEVAVAIAAAIDRQFATVNDPAIFTTAKLSGDTLRIFGHSVSSPFVQLATSNGTLPGDFSGQFNNTTRDRHKGLPNNLPADPPEGFEPKLEGIYIDDFTIGLASRGEMATNALPAAVDFTTIPSIPGASTRILTGPYQLKIGSTDSGSGFNVNDRFARGLTLVAPPASQLLDGQTFTIDDGFTALVFEFDTNNLITAGNRRVTVFNGASAADVATLIRDAINNAFAGQLTKVRASTTISPAGATGNRVDLFDAVQFLSSGSLGLLVFGAAGGRTTTGMGDVNGVFGQHQVSSAAGQTIIQNNSISDARQVGIQVIPLIGQISETGVAFTDLGRFPTGVPGYTGGIANLPVLNTRGWVPGVTVKNNLVVSPGRTGIQVGGDPNASYAYAQRGDRGANALRDIEIFLPFVRVVNNTIYDAKNGIAATNASSPTIVNNIIANSGVTPTAVIQTRGAAIYVDDSAGGAKSLPAGLTARFGDTIVAANLYQNNSFNVLGTSDSNAIALAAIEPLFVDASKRNFYLAENSRAIDSSVNSIQERSTFQSTPAALGIPPSPIQAPETDLLGQLRVDDPSVPTPPGLGSNIFKDRGALERADFIGPTAALVNPIDNDPSGIDRNQQPNRVVLVNQQLTDFRVQLLDGVGVGIDDSTVDISKFVIQRTIGTTTATLTPNFDYLMAYDTNSKIVRFIPSQGIWINGTYTITLDNSADPIKDLANHALQANEPPNTQFVIQLTDTIVSPWQNPTNKFDVNADGRVAGLDLLLIINRLPALIGPLPLVAVVPPYIDVSGDGRLSLVDAVQLINHILANTPPPPAPPAAPLATTITTLEVDEPGASPAASAAATDSVTVGLAMSDASGSIEPADLSPWAPLADPMDTVAVASVATASAATSQAAGAWAATIESDELDALDDDLDSILADLTGDLGDH